MLHAVIMAGGAGTRFWPASRRARPKQLLELAGGRTMIQATVDRLGQLVTPPRILIVTNRALVAPIAAQLPQLAAQAIVGEPCKRDTAPCIGLAAHCVAQSDPEATMVVMPADHVIAPEAAFQEAVREACALVERRPSRIVTFGIPPTYPAETFGYIERGEPVSGAGDRTFQVSRFREKPSARTARGFLDAGTFYWNSGIFVWKAATILAALDDFEPDMARRLRTIGGAVGSPEFGSVLEREFSAIQGKSIDYAVMERYHDVVVMEAPFSWDDAGSWQALARIAGKDAAGNTFVGRHLDVNTRDTIVRSDSGHLVVTLGVSDLIIVHTPDATLVANKHDEESIREVVRLLEEKGWSEFL